MKSVFLGAALIASILPQVAHALPAPAPRPAAPALDANQAERILQRDMNLVARCEAGKTALFLGRLHGEALDTMVAFEDGRAVRYPVQGGRFEQAGDKLSARFAEPEAFRLSLDGPNGRLLYAADAKRNQKVSCRFFL